MLHLHSGPTLKMEARCYFDILLIIQGDSGGISTTLGYDSMSDSKQKSSYEHGSNFERLRSYGHFLISVHALIGTAFTEPAGGCWLTVCIASITFASWLAHPATYSAVSVSRHLVYKGKVGWVFAWLQADSNAAAGYKFPNTVLRERLVWNY